MITTIDAIDAIDALLTDGRSALADLHGASPGGGLVTSETAARIRITPGDVVRHNGAWVAVAGVGHDGVTGITRLAMIDKDGVLIFDTMIASDVIEVRTDARIDPDTLYKLADRSCAVRYVTTQPGALSSAIPDKQLAGLLAGEYDPGYTVTTMEDVDDLTGRAVGLLDERDETHLIRDVKVWPLRDGTGEALITIDRPAGPRLSTLTVQAEVFAGHTAKEALTALLAIARTEIGRMDALVASAAPATAVTRTPQEGVMATPDELLAAVRKAQFEVGQALDASYGDLPRREAMENPVVRWAGRLLAAAGALDEHLMGGGQRPADWQRAEPGPDQAARYLLRLITLITQYGEIKFGADEWWPGNAEPYLGVDGAAELDGLLDFASGLQAKTANEPAAADASPRP